MCRRLRSTRCRSPMANSSSSSISGAMTITSYWRPEDWRWKNLEKKHHPTGWLKRDERLVLSRHVRHLAAGTSGELAGLCESRRSARLCALARQTAYRRKRNIIARLIMGPMGGSPTYPWGNTPPALQHGNFDFAAWSPVPVGSRPAGASRWGVHGTGRQWLGADGYAVCAVAGFYALYDELSGLLEGFFRRQTFCRQRCFLGHRRRICAAELFVIGIKLIIPMCSRSFAASSDIDQMERIT